MSRWISAVAVLVGLAAMHGIAASSASAAAPCGVAVTHVHGPAPTETDLGGAATTRVSAPDPVDVGHAGMACLVVLLAGVALALTLRRRHTSGLNSAPLPRAVVSPRSGRGPPALLLTCVSRT